MNYKRQTASLPLADVGLGPLTRAILYLLSCFPFVGFVIGSSYSLRHNNQTRRLGFQLLLFAALIHGAYMVCGCPVALYLAAQ